MRRRSRQAHRVIWVNRLAGDPKFQPLGRELVATLPFVDELIAGHSIKGLENPAKVWRAGPHTRAGGWAAQGLPSF
ncbi:MAG: hypothetical protein F4Z17_05600 [Acidimicrobiia bacterium]|nr:hypothetical protein [Acidimicrobiia bacterium]